MTKDSIKDVSDAIKRHGLATVFACVLLGQVMWSNYQATIALDAIRLQLQTLEARCK